MFNVSSAPVLTRVFFSGVHVQGCRVNRVIFGIYAPGLFLYVLKKPKSQFFGFHEYFHTSVIAGHIASMLFDLRDVMAPCARVARSML